MPVYVGTPCHGHVRTPRKYHTVTTPPNQNHLLTEFCHPCRRTHRLRLCRITYRLQRSTLGATVVITQKPFIDIVSSLPYFRNQIYLPLNPSFGIPSRNYIEPSSLVWRAEMSKLFQQTKTHVALPGRAITGSLVPCKGGFPKIVLGLKAVSCMVLDFQDIQVSTHHALLNRPKLG